MVNITKEYGLETPKKRPFIVAKDLKWIFLILLILLGLLSAVWAFIGKDYYFGKGELVTFYMMDNNTAIIIRDKTASTFSQKDGANYYSSHTPFLSKLSLSKVNLNTGEVIHKAESKGGFRNIPKKVLSITNGHIVIIQRNKGFEVWDQELDQIINFQDLQEQYPDLKYKNEELPPYRLWADNDGIIHKVELQAKDGSWIGIIEDGSSTSKLKLKDDGSPSTFGQKKTMVKGFLNNWHQDEEFIHGNTGFTSNNMHFLRWSLCFAEQFGFACINKTNTDNPVIIVDQPKGYFVKHQPLLDEGWKLSRIDTSGKELWQIDINAESGIVQNNKLIVAAGFPKVKSIICIDIQNGRELWMKEF